MEWIDVKDQHFVDLKITKDTVSTTYEWIELPCCPQEPFLVGLDTNMGFQWARVILGECGLVEITDDGENVWGWSIADVQYWTPIASPIKNS